MEYTIDCKGKVLGRVASEIAMILQGKKTATYNPRLEGEDTVLIKNVDKLSLTGRKLDQKVYYSHTTQIGHLKERKIKDVIEKHGMEWVLRKAVMRMLPKNRLQIRRIKRMIIEK
jgi:large subunit ribosomal protein L13